MGFFDRFRSQSATPPAPAVAPAPSAAPQERASALASRATLSAPTAHRPHPVAGISVRSLPISSLEFAVVDLETTGLSPEADRIVELACVRCDASGRVLAELHSLVDPDMGGYVGPTAIHGITPQMVAGAPRFAEIVPTLAPLLDGAVLVAHNAGFDRSFLRQELVRCGHDIDEPPTICTMSFRRQVGLPGPRAHRLIWGCWQEGVPIEAAHAAACDARATGSLLARYLDHAQEYGIQCLGDVTARGRMAESWENGLLAVRPLPSRGDGRLTPRDISPTPTSLRRDTRGDGAGIPIYARQLAAACEDFEIDEWELENLHALICEFELNGDQVRAAHLERLAVLLEDRLDDGLLTWAEQQEVKAFGRLLGVPADDVIRLFEDVAERAEVEPMIELDGSRGDGLTVVFTGEFVAIPMTRDEVCSLAEDAGMRVTKAVSGKTELLVCLDPTTGTTKLRRAAECGTVVIDQDTFLGIAGAAPAPERVVAEVFQQLARRREVDGSATQARRAAAAEKARARNRERRSSATPVTQSLWCRAGGHEWTRNGQRGRPPANCPAHTPT